MKRTDAAVKVRTKNAEKVNANVEVNKAAITTMAIAAGLVGAWVITAFVGGILASGGVMPLVSNWIGAVFG
jgi:F0F1-type ATP synthase assembly protein I